MERRGFIEKCLRWSAWLLGGSFLAYPVFSFMTFGKARGKKVIFFKEDQAGAVTFKAGVFLVREQSDEFALSAQCTHLGCTLNYDAMSGRFECPCHGSVFARSGKRIAGPARKDLDRVPLTRTANGDAEAALEIG